MAQSDMPGEISLPAASAPAAVPTSAEADRVVARLERLPFLSLHFRVASILGTGMVFDAFDTLVISVAVVTIATTFQLNAASTGILLSSGFAGQLLGAIICGYVSEIYGRKMTFVYGLALFGLFSLLSAFAWNLGSLLILRMVVGLGIGGIPPVATALFSEYLPGRSRGTGGMVFGILFAVGYLVASPLAILSSSLFSANVSWRALFVFGAIPLVLALFAYLRLPESVRWLLSKHRTEEAERIVTQIEAQAEGKGKHLKDLDTLPAYHADVQRTRFGELFSPHYYRRTVLTWVQWFTAYFVLGGFASWLPTMFVNLGGLSRNVAYSLIFVTGLCELALIVIAALTWDRVGRRPWFIGGYAVSAISAVIGIFAITSLHASIALVLATAGLLVLLGVYISVGGVYLYASELYPTRMRSWGTSTGRAISAIGNILGPLIVGAMLTARLGLSAIFVLFGAVALVGLAAMLALGVETKRKVLEEIAA